MLTEKTHIEVRYVANRRQLDEASDVVSSPLVIENAALSEVGPKARRKKNVGSGSSIWIARHRQEYLAGLVTGNCYRREIGHGRHQMTRWRIRIGYG